MRRAHQGGILQGRFESSADARTLSSAVLFTQPNPIIARVSGFTGLSDIPDTNGTANPRGFAVKVLPADGSNLDIVNHNSNGFSVSSAAYFSILLQVSFHERQ